MVGSVSNIINTNPFGKFGISDDKYKNAFLKPASIARTLVTDMYDKQYYNDEKVKKSKRNKIILASVLIPTVLAGASILTLLVKNKKLDITKYAEDIMDTQTGKKIYSFGEKVGNVMGNIVNIKDDVYDDLIVEKTRDKKGLNFVSKVADWIRDVYSKGVKASSRKTWDKTYQELTELSAKYNISLEELGIKDFDSFFDSTMKSMVKTIKEDRIVKMPKSLSKEELNVFMENAKKLLNDMPKKNFAEEKFRDIILDGLADIKLDGDYPQDFLEAVNKYNKVKMEECKTLLPKIKDMACGDAPTDLLTTTIAIGGLGIATVNAEDKEERKSILIKLGIPVVSTLACTTFATLKKLSGAKALLFGLATGKIVSSTAEAISKKIDEKASKAKTENKQTTVA